MKRILIHICCAPCSIYPLEVLHSTDTDIIGFFYNPNIHPSREYMLRRDTLISYSKKENLPVIIGDYKPEYFLEEVIGKLENRCFYCYKMRFEETAKKAKELGIKTFTTTLLYSKRQNHGLIKEIGLEIAEREGLNFYYHDFREGWKKGIEKSKELGLYRQNYCGCIFSEKERFYKNGSGLL